MRPYEDWNLAFVTHASPEEALAFRAEMRAPQSFLCDLSAAMYEEAGFGRARFGQVASLRVFVRGAQAVRHGMRRPNADPLRLGGALVMASGGEVTWHRPARDVADNPSPDEVRAALGF